MLPSQIVDQLNQFKENSNADKVEKLQSIILQLNLEKLQNSIKLEAKANQTINEIPKINRELTMIKEEILKFSELVIQAQEKLLKEYQKTVMFDELVQLDRVATNMNATRSCLKDADNWNTVTAEMESYFASGDLEKGASRLAEAQRSLEMLSTASNLEARKALLASLNDRFTLLVENALLLALKEGNMEEMARNVKLSERIGHKVEVIELYYQFKKADYHQFWTGGADPSERISDLFKGIELLLEQDFAILNTISTNLSDDFHGLLSRLFADLKPSLSEVLQSTMNNHSRVGVQKAATIFDVCLTFGMKIETKFPFTADSTSLPKWGDLLFKDFMLYQANYASLERKVLQQFLTTLDSLQPFEAKSKAILEITDEVLNRYAHVAFSSERVNIGNVFDEFFSAAILKLSPPVIKKLQTVNPAISTLQSQMFQVTDAFETNFHKECDKLTEFVNFCERLLAFKSVTIPQFTFDEHWTKNSYICKPSLQFWPKSDINPRTLANVSWKFGNEVKLVTAQFQRLVIDAILAPVSDFLSYVPQLSAWTAPLNDSKSNIIPSPYITCIGEHMLTIPHYFDPYMQSESLKFSLETLPFYEIIEAETVDPEDEEELDSVHFWIKSIIRVAEENYLQSLLLIKSLSHQGQKQLAVDILYLKNTMAFLEIDVNPELELYLFLLKAEKEQIQQKLSTEESPAHKDLIKTVVKAMAVEI